MLTLAFAQIVWSIAFQWDASPAARTGWSASGRPRGLADKARLLLVHAGARRAPRWSRSPGSRSTPFGYALRAGRDSPLRAEAIGIDVRRTQWMAFALAGAFAGLAGGLFAFSKGSISPETLAIPRSVDALVMVLLGGLNALAGPLLGAAAFTWLQDYARARDRLLARGARRGDPAHRARVSDGHRRRAAARAGAGSAMSATAAPSAIPERAAEVPRLERARARGQRPVQGLRRRATRCDDVSFAVARRRARRADRTQRRRQDDLLQPRQRPARARRRRGARSRARASTARRRARSRGAASAARSRSPRRSRR